MISPPKSDGGEEVNSTRGAHSPGQPRVEVRRPIYQARPGPRTGPRPVRPNWRGSASFLSSKHSALELTSMILSAHLCAWFTVSMSGLLSEHVSFLNSDGKNAGLPTRLNQWWGNIPFITSGVIIILYRIYTSILFHGSILHIVFNMLALIPLGTELERIMGSIRLLYLMILLATSNAIFHLIIAFIVAQNPLHPYPFLMHECAIGFSGVIFSMIVIETSLSGVQTKRAPVALIAPHLSSAARSIASVHRRPLKLLYRVDWCTG
ncbi:hypothetical protein KSP40_PGU013529 [Platanthera guangdongensis]|uniref:Peptidase S54 rhomboid domain-containing protein n=1 Tax=Platanthera guangdongensis TaxID=2320717 RepID=A0ABR2MZY6_9ASPA